MDNKRVKLAVIRSDDDTPCPFGLKISFACRTAGEHIDNMFPLDNLGPEADDDEKQKVSSANMRLLSWKLMHSAEEPKQCVYASKLFPTHKNKVDCNWGAGDAGIPQRSALVGSPFYSQIFSGVGLDGLYSYPIGFYADSNISRNLFYGAMSLQGRIEMSQRLLKLASEVIEQYAEYVDIAITGNNIEVSLKKGING